MGFTALVPPVRASDLPDELNWRRVRRYADRRVADRLMQSMDDPDNIRQDLVARVRAEIASGTYETQEKIDKVVERIIEDL